ncbi:MAG: hypothetical protein ACKVI8_07185 [Paraglaciecola sp.]
MSWQDVSLAVPNSIQSAAALADLHALATNVSAVLIHPFQYGVGEGDSPTVLSFTNAVSSLAIKLDEGKHDAVLCVAFAASTLSQLSADVQSAIDNMGLLWLLTVKQRASLLKDLENAKFTIVEPSLTPVLQRTKHTVLHAGKLAECYSAKAIELTNQEAKTAIGDIATELSDFESKKADHDSVATSALSNVEFGSVKGLAFKASGSNLGAQVKSAAGPGSEKSLTAILCFMGTENELTLLTELVGL